MAVEGLRRRLAKAAGLMLLVTVCLIGVAAFAKAEPGLSLTYAAALAAAGIAFGDRPSYRAGLASLPLLAVATVLYLAGGQSFTVAVGFAVLLPAVALALYAIEILSRGDGGGVACTR